MPRISRKAEGFTRECHGDIHLGNVTLIDGNVVIFDCIEFNEPFRFTDVYADTAFLAMDLEDRGLKFLLAKNTQELVGDANGRVQAIRDYVRDSDPVALAYDEDGRAYVAGLEPNSSYPTNGLPDAVSNGSAMTIEPGGERPVRRLGFYADDLSRRENGVAHGTVLREQSGRPGDVGGDARLGFFRRRPDVGRRDDAGEGPQRIAAGHAGDEARRTGDAGDRRGAVG